MNKTNFIIIACSALIFIILLSSYFNHINTKPQVSYKNEETTEVPDNACPYTIHYNNYDYLLSEDTDSWSVNITKLEKLGVIVSTVKLSQMPKENFEANCLCKGLTIYRYSEDEILIEYPNGSGKYQIFKKTEES